MEKRALSVSYAVLPDQGEDSFALRANTSGAMLCVADGCGGLGGRRYHNLGDHTGAYLASRLATRAFVSWEEERGRLPETSDEGRVMCAELESDMEEILRGFAKKNCQSNEPCRIVGSMQRLLPTTLCAVLADTAQAAATECCFLWAGDSRGYALDAAGLHQYTSDHVRGGYDSFESLYRDGPLNNILSADQPVKLSARRATMTRPSVLICATDGAFGCLPTPMEFEMMLLSTMLAANSLDGWRKKMEIALHRLAHDDATILCMLCGFANYDDAKRVFEPRRCALQQAYITPVRRRKSDLEFARARWKEYQKGYDCTEGGLDESKNWRI